MFRASTFNYTDGTPDLLRDINVVNQIDQEQFSLFGIRVFYYKFAKEQSNFDGVFRDFLSSPDYEEPIEVRSFLNMDPNTAHGITETGAVQNAERNGTASFNIALIESILGRPPIPGDVLFSLHLKQKFQIFDISKDTFRLNKPLRYLCKVRLYQDSR